MGQNVTFLFWNTCNKISSTESELSKFLNSNEYDIIILAEADKPLTSSFCTTHDIEEVSLEYEENESLKQRIYKRKEQSEITFSHLNNIGDNEEEERIIQETISGVIIERIITRISRVVLLELKVKRNKYLLACVHFPSKKNQDEISQLQIAHNFKRYILERSSKYEDKVIIVGDFNMNPFDAGMVEPHGFYSLNFHEIVKNKKIFQHSPEQMFYNPCWTLLGDNDKTKFKIPGTYYYVSSPSKKLYWHLFDQIVLSEKMIKNFSHSDLEIIENPLMINEMIKSKPKKNTIYSDHLPIKFTLNL